MDWQDTSHFLALSSQAMRRILTDYARGRNAAKRGGVRPIRLSLDDEITHPSSEQNEALASLDEALTRLAQLFPRQARIVEMRFYGGLTEEQIAQVEKVAPRTVKRDWEKARAWLLGELRNSGNEASL